MPAFAGLIVQNISIKAHTVISDGHDIVFIIGGAGNRNGAAAGFPSDSVFDRIFHGQLNGKRGNFEILVLNVINDVEFLSKPELFKIQIMILRKKLNMLKSLRNTLR